MPKQIALYNEDLNKARSESVSSLAEKVFKASKYKRIGIFFKGLKFHNFDFVHEI